MLSISVNEYKCLLSVVLDPRSPPQQKEAARGALERCNSLLLSPPVCTPPFCFPRMEPGMRLSAVQVHRLAQVIQLPHAQFTKKKIQAIAGSDLVLLSAILDILKLRKEGCIEPSA